MEIIAHEGLEVSAGIIHAVILCRTVQITLFSHQSVNASFQKLFLLDVVWFVVMDTANSGRDQHSSVVIHRAAYYGEHRCPIQPQHRPKLCSKRGESHRWLPPFSSPWSPKQLAGNHVVGGGKPHICRRRPLLPRINLRLLERRPFFQHRANRIKAAAPGTGPYPARYRDTNTGGVSPGAGLSRLNPREDRVMVVSEEADPSASRLQART